MNDHLRTLWPKFDPANPHNKTADGKLSEDGVECCYRMFDEGKSRFEAAVEETFVNTNGQSTLKLGHARAAVMIAPAQAGLLVAEYSTTVVKKAVVGTGAADKDQVAFMIARLLPTAGGPTKDAADALAVAIAHAHARKARRLGAAA